MDTKDVFKSLIEIREPEFMFAMSYLSRAGIDLVEQPNNAKQFLEEQVAQDQPEAQFALARLLSVGAFGEIDRRSAFDLYTRASDSGYTPALVGLAHFYINGWAGLEIDKDRGISLLEVGAKRGYAHAAAYLATAYAEGTLGPRDQSKSRDYLRLAAELGNADAQYLLGSELLDAEGLEKAKEAISWLKMAAEQGSASAHRRLSSVYSTGAPGIPKNVELSAHYRRQAEEIDGYSG